MLIHGHILIELQKMPGESVDCVMTSPPYFGLRSYQSVPQIWGGTADCVHEWESHNKKWHSGTNAGEKQLTDGGAFHNNFSNETNFCVHCNAWKGELGLEPTHSLYIEHLMSVFDEIQRVLKKAGTCWVNISDSYAGSGKASGQNIDQVSKKQATNFNSAHLQTYTGITAKSLIAIPERFMIAMIDRGWICRNVIIWWKRSCMPESVGDRFTRDFEYLYYFTKHKDSYFEKQFVQAEQWGTRDRLIFRNGTEDIKLKQHGLKNDTSSQGRNKRTVWDIPTQPLLIDMCLTCGHIYDSSHSIKISRDGDKQICYFCNGTTFASHYASYPVVLCKTPIMAGCPAEICSKCGKIREKVYKKTPMKIKRTNWGNRAGNRTASSGTVLEPNKAEFIGYTDCGCHELYFVPGVVLDPFLGSGTTAIAAKELGRDYIGIDISEKYLKFAQYRLDRTTRGMV